MSDLMILRLKAEIEIQRARAEAAERQVRELKLRVTELEARLWSDEEKPS